MNPLSVHLAWVTEDVFAKNLRFAVVAGFAGRLLHERNQLPLQHALALHVCVVHEMHVKRIEGHRSLMPGFCLMLQEDEAVVMPFNNAV